jgi:transcriptional regulator of NAD metabolism
LRPRQFIGGAQLISNLSINAPEDRLQIFATRLSRNSLYAVQDKVDGVVNHLIKRQFAFRTVPTNEPVKHAEDIQG